MHQEQAAREMQKALGRIQDSLHSQGLHAEATTKVGSAADVLVQLAEDYDVVVAGALNRTERPGPGLGPVVSRLVEHVNGTVFVGRALRNDQNYKILIPIDGSSSSQNALEIAGSTFVVEDAELTIMHVIEKAWLRLGLEQEWPAEFERPYAEAAEQPETEKLFATELRREAEEIVEEGRTHFSSRSLAVDSRIVEGNPANEILREAEIGDYDLIVLGATGVSDLKHTILGSTSFKVASYAPCSVAVTR
jgi:nucleotide-binding universal stress UspA family protein